jgi:hypothetical protein
MSKGEKTYIKGSARAKKFDNGGHVINVSINLNQLTKLPHQESGGEKYVRFTIASRREPDDWGNTHSIYNDGWTPDGNKSGSKKASSSKKKDDIFDDTDDGDDLFD